jgi:excisionase family DNA binding protein
VARETIEAVAIDAGVCIRPLALAITDTTTGETSIIDVPCGARLASKCPPCADKARRVRMQQCRDGWHAVTEPVPERNPPTRSQKQLVAERAGITLARDQATEGGDDGTAEACQDALDELDGLIEAAGVRGRVEPEAKPRRIRSTRRRQDAADLPSGQISSRTVGRTFTGHDGTVFRPSMSLTLTLPSYGRVDRDTGTPVNPARYDYQRAARDAIHFGKLLDRFIQNLRRMAGYDVQYFAAVEPQRRLAPHVHLAIRGTIPRSVIRDTIAATYAQVWWPPADRVVYDGDRLPVWTPTDQPHTGPLRLLADMTAAADEAGCYVDPDTGAALPTWDEALDQAEASAEGTEDGEDGTPHHVVRFGRQFDAQGFLAGTPDADQRIGYLAKYLTKSIADCHEVAPELAAHVDRLAAALRYQPCSPTCPNWLRFGIQPRHPRPGMRPGHCTGKAHARTHLGYGGRRGLVSRRWTGKTLTDHRADHRAVVLAALGVDPDQATADDKTADRYHWQPAPAEQVPPLHRRLLHGIAQRWRWRTEYDAAKRAAGHRPLGPPGAERTPDVSANTDHRSRRLTGDQLMPRLIDPLLTVDQAAEHLGTGPRFVRRLIAERRITFVHVGRHVRVPESALIAFVTAGTVEPRPPRQPLVARRRSVA